MDYATAYGDNEPAHIDLHDAMREWIADCDWADLATDSWGEGLTIASLTDRQVEAGIARHYAGGIVQFIRDGS